MTLELTMVLLLNNRSDFEDTTKIVWQFHFKMKNVPFCSLAYIFIILTSIISDIYLNNEKNENILMKQTLPFVNVCFKVKN